MATTADRLRAQAQGGQLGLAAYDDAQKTIASSRSEAAAAALAGAGTRQAPAGAQAEIDRIVSSPAAYYTEAAGIGRDIASQNIGAAGAAQAAYLASVGRHGGVGATSRASGGGGTMSGPYNRYGGYDSSGEFDNAATGGALSLQQEALAAAEAQHQQALADREAARQAGSYEARGRAEWERMQAAQTGVPATTATRVVPSGRPGTQAESDRRQYAASAYEDFIARQTTPELQQARVDNLAAQREAIARSDAARSATVQQAQDALETQALLQTPQALQELRNQFAVDYLGADPMEARGRFAPLTDMEIMGNELERAEIEEQYSNLMSLGNADAEIVASNMFSDATEGLDLQAVASSFNMDPMVLAAKTATPSFNEAFNHVLTAGDPVAAVLSIPDPISAAILVEMLSLDPRFAQAYDLAVRQSQMPTYD